ncbi:hypothetical protein Acsp04_47560 [Actinomadura sp. NBRC 104425]|uniref:DUF1998 domain-containing protein n=1 Tax=Actinomadura sp. NBRC 104425 TaxID=3032204 RepID=UPI0024A0D09B|nr:DUF1998 domain-containing protein [Actinomadura sp. NBRC 104425]GLZ14521.1 hypothetical protein Acsp04_47560 [Actinomadura sp. NBRC 104425]
MAATSDRYFRRVGAVRPSHLMFTSGVGALVDLPNFAVLVRGLDDWDTGPMAGYVPLTEPRLLKAVQGTLGDTVKQLRPAPWMPGIDSNPAGPASKVGVPVMPFPSWMRCTVCDQLAPLDSQIFGFENDKARKPHDAHFFHADCPRKRSGRKPLAVPARFVLACNDGHLDDFPYVNFVHKGTGCPKASHPTLKMDDRGGNLGANVALMCVSCGEKRNIRDALGRRGEENLPRCRGRHPHLGTFEEGCERDPKVLVIGASNQWFPETLSALYVPPTDAGELADKVVQYWDQGVGSMPGREYLRYSRENVPAFREFTKWSDEEIWAAIEQRRKILEEGRPEEKRRTDLRTAEWEIFTSPKEPEPSDDFALRRDPDGVPAELKEIFSDVVQVERLREVRALIGFTRLDAPDPDEPDLVKRAPLAKDRPTWVPASEVRGEGIFLRVPERLLQEWEERVEESDALDKHREAYKRFRENRQSDRLPAPTDPMRGWPGARYIALHTLSHLLIRTIALECGYSSASLSELIYSGTEDDPNRSGILIYTAVPDAEGTLGGLVSLAEPDALVRLTRRALADARRCSSDPLCADRLPEAPEDFLHGAACHVCLFVSETTCERGNRFLDRRFVVPIDDPSLALFPAVP